MDVGNTQVDVGDDKCLEVVNHIHCNFLHIRVLPSSLRSGLKCFLKTVVSVLLAYKSEILEFPQINYILGFFFKNMDFHIPLLKTLLWILPYEIHTLTGKHIPRHLAPVVLKSLPCPTPSFSHNNIFPFPWTHMPFHTTGLLHMLPYLSEMLRHFFVLGKFLFTFLNLYRLSCSILCALTYLLRPLTRVLPNSYSEALPVNLTGLESSEAECFIRFCIHSICGRIKWIERFGVSLNFKEQM